MWIAGGNAAMLLVAKALNMRPRADCAPGHAVHGTLGRRSRCSFAVGCYVRLGVVVGGCLRRRDDHAGAALERSHAGAA